MAAADQLEIRGMNIILFVEDIKKKNKLVLLSRACPFDDLVREGIQLKLMILGFGLRLSAYVSLFLTHYVMTNKYSF